VQDRPHPPVLDIADPVQDQALPHRVPQPQPPVLPGQRVPLEGEARPVRLGDDDRPQVVAHRIEGAGVAGIALDLPGDELRDVVAQAFGNRDDTAVGHLDHHHPVEVDQHQQALHGVGVAAVVGPGPQVGQGPGQPPPRVVDRPRVPVPHMSIATSARSSTPRRAMAAR
jgi:hypothetical protein